jgi:hypothetical protein
MYRLLGFYLLYTIYKNGDVSLLHKTLLIYSFSPHSLPIQTSETAVSLP